MDFRLDLGMDSVLDPGLKIIIIDHVLSRKLNLRLMYTRVAFPKK